MRVAIFCVWSRGGSGGEGRGEGGGGGFPMLRAIDIVF